MSIDNPKAARLARAAILGLVVVAAGAAGAILLHTGRRADAPTGISARTVSPALPSSQAVAPGDWTTLTSAQSSALSPLRKRWTALDAVSKAHWIQVADRLQGRPWAEIARAKRHMDAWQQLSPAQRAQARLRYSVAVRLSSDERGKRWIAYQATLHGGSLANSRVPATGRDWGSLPSAGDAAPISVSARSAPTPSSVQAVPLERSAVPKSAASGAES